MIVFPNAKINLGLFVTEKRNDGYHNIETLFMPVGWYDVLEILPAKSFSLKTYGREIPGDKSENLVHKAWQLLNEKYNIPAVETHLIKNIPMGAGLGGGSADGAFMLKTLNDFFELKLSIKTLEHYAAQLGSDCAFFIQNKPSVAKGRGEILKAFDLNFYAAFELLIIWNQTHIETGKAFSGISPKPAPEKWMEVFSTKPDKWHEMLRNDFEQTIFPANPKLEKIKKQMLEAGALYAAMSGSGSAIFGIYKKGAVNKKLINQFNIPYYDYRLTTLGEW